MSNSKDVNWKDFSFCIRIAGNTWPRSIIALHQKGYAIKSWCILSYDENGKEKYNHTYEAKKNHRLFSASSPVELIGLVAIWETRGDSWQKVNNEEWRFYDKFEKESRIYNEEGKDISDE